MNNKVLIKKLKPNAIIPTKGSEYAAGFDLYACVDEPVKIAPFSTEKISTGLSMQPPKGYFGAIFARSGLATKQGLRPANCTGICDEDYRGEYIVALHNDSVYVQTVNPNDRIAQIIFLPYLNMEFLETDELDDTKRGTGGFGSTGVNNVNDSE